MSPTRPGDGRAGVVPNVAAIPALAVAIASPLYRSSGDEDAVRDRSPHRFGVRAGPPSAVGHGIFTGVGVVVGAWFLLRDVRRAGSDAEVVTSILTRAVVTALIGARLAYVINHWSRFDSVLEVRTRRPPRST